ncbi:hypothetical protein AJ78_08831 [Emergomyces pasteurianus Ep9510]|uniref:Uncharacterized protein n=1 Tax=Emergomyces pasteurianus Ep9510 TaxID=1447872 RepID=A0A1J9Q124_9EURO|nr:hypothetical protein AJ78_08831 [Emergomyces pasteurianus Ep9510]
MGRGVVSSFSKTPLIISCYIPSELPTPILKPLKTLEELKYSTGDLYSSDAYQDRIDPTILGQDLRPHKYTLRVLDMMDPDEFGWWFYRRRRVDDCESATPVPPATK